MLSALLLPAEDRVLEVLARTNPHDPLRRDLDRLAGLRVAAHARLPVRQDHLADSRNDERATPLGLLDRQSLDLLHDGSDLLLRQAGLAGQVTHRCRLRHDLRHRTASSQGVVVTPPRTGGCGASLVSASRPAGPVSSVPPRTEPGGFSFTKRNWLDAVSRRYEPNCSSG